MFVSTVRLTAFAGLAFALLATACEKQPPPGATDDPAPARADAPRAGSPVLPPELAPSPSSKAGKAGTPLVAPPTAAPEAPYTGPWFAVTSPAAGVYSETSFERGKKIGFMRSGGRAPVEPEAIAKKNCSGGWYKVRSGGFVCGNYGTTDLNNPEVKFATSQPNLKDILPYPYARNAKNGTPLYKTVPSREQMERYEPYLKDGDKKDKEKDAAAKPPSDRAVAVAEKLAAAAAADKIEPALPIAAQDAGTTLLPAPAPAAADPEPDKPWWQQDDIKDRLHEMKLDALTADSDDILAKRMVSGFYVAVDKTFRWNGRSWYKTTKGLVTPSDRMWQTSGSSFKGVELDGTTYKLPMGWVYGGNKSAGTFIIDTAANTIKNAKSIDRFVPIALTGKSLEFQGKDYVELTDGTFMKKAQLRITEPGPPPQGLAENERYIDVDLSTQTLVAFEGSRPVYATLISSGKFSKIKDKDHSTPTGEWRIREKHITTTMDGDGTAAGDLPYSIEDVPFVQYYFRSFALHAAFWHSNFGVQMSHGCVNLSPLDAKWLFFFTGPHLPEGFHGVWASESEAGSRVIVHD